MSAAITAKSLKQANNANILLVAKRGRPFARGDVTLYRCLRNRVNRVRKSLQTQYFLDKVQKLKNGSRVVDTVDWGIVGPIAR